MQGSFAARCGRVVLSRCASRLLSVYHATAVVSRPSMPISAAGARFVCALEAEPHVGCSRQRAALADCIRICGDAPRRNSPHMAVTANMCRRGGRVYQYRSSIAVSSLTLLNVHAPECAPFPAAGAMRCTFRCSWPRMLDHAFDV